MEKEVIPKQGGRTLLAKTTGQKTNMERDPKRERKPPRGKGGTDGRNDVAEN